MVSRMGGFERLKLMLVVLFGADCCSEQRRIDMREPAPTNDNTDLPIGQLSRIEENLTFRLGVGLRDSAIYT
jgi:hypothetical protein